MADISKITALDGITYNLKDAAVPSWAKSESKPTYTASEVGALPDSTPIHNVPSGGSAGQVLSKASGTDYDLEWSTPSGGGSYILTYDENSSVGLAEVDTAVTGEPNYIPSGDIQQTMENISFMTGASVTGYIIDGWNVSFSNGTLTLALSRATRPFTVTPTTATKSVATSAPVFVGNGVHFVIEENEE